ncbi:MAG: O-antigen/teichoic acid export membrane protein [Oceanospirillaceae bacterium]|jgi:O-antigen/teichoic acid export membrane protein
MPKPEFKSDSSVKRILKNSLFVALRFAVYALSGFLFIPFLVNHYGAGSYGLIALAGFLTQYVGMISGSVGSSVARFLNIALNKNDWQQANEIFSTAMVANIAFILLQLPLFALGVWKLDWIISFSPEVATDFRILVICNITVFFISMLTGVLQTPIEASNRLDIGAKIDVIRLTLRLILLVSLILWIGPNLWIIGAVDVVLSLLNAGVMYKVYRNLAVHLVFKKAYITKKWIRPVLSMSGWSLLIILGFSLFLKTDVWLINRFITPELAGIYAAFLLFPNFIKQVAGQFSGLISPVYLIDYSKGNLERVAEVCSFAYKVVFVFGVFSACTIALFSQEIIEILFPLYIDHAYILNALMFASTISVLGDVLRPLFKAYNRMHLMGFVYIVTGFLNLLLSFFFIKLGLGVFGIILGTGISLFIRDLICSTLLATNLINKGNFYLLKNTLIGFCIAGLFISSQLLFDSTPLSSFILIFSGIYILVNEKKMILMGYQFIKKREI